MSTVKSFWNPVACDLQLKFTGTSPKSASDNKEETHGLSSAILPRSSYTGISTIRYHREPLPLPALRYLSSEDNNGDHTNALSTIPVLVQSEQDAFYHHLAHAAEMNALHFHACTLKENNHATTVAPTSSHSCLHPVRGLSYQLRDVASGEVLKIHAIREEDVVVESNDTSRHQQGKLSGKANHLRDKGKHTATRKEPSGVVSVQKKSSSLPDAAASNPNASFSLLDQTGSKLLLFVQHTDLKLGSVLELQVRFTGVVQSPDAGAIYSPIANHNNNNDALEKKENRFPVLTHFEVALARWAFPCPDHPQYRLRWRLRTLELPPSYQTALTNTGARSNRGAKGRRASFSFSAVGPLPAYLFAFAAFDGGLEKISRPLPLPPARDFFRFSTKGSSSSRSILAAPLFRPGPAASYAAEMTQTSETESTSSTKCDYQLHVFARALSRDRLEWIAHITSTAVTLAEDFFHSPLPLLRPSQPHDYEHESHDEDEAEKGAFCVLLAPMMPYLSGMEHHTCVFLNESLFQTPSGTGRKHHPRNIKNDRGGGGAAVETAPHAVLEQVELIVHEVLHHWIGNAIGLPFAVKEGVCLVLEKVFADLILYGKVRRRVVGLDGNGVRMTTTSMINNIQDTESSSPRQRIGDPKKGKEFTGAAYRQAQLDLQKVIERCGFPHFRERLVALVRSAVLAPMLLSSEDDNSSQPQAEVSSTLGKSSILAAGPPRAMTNFCSTEEFFAWIECSS